MDFLRIIRSLEEFLYEVMTWLVFYPRTLWRTLRHPIVTLRYSDKELTDKPDRQFTDLMSPPLFLMITIVLSHLIEQSAHQALPQPTTDIGKQITASEQNLLILRSILFAIYPLMFAMRCLTRQALPLDRDTLRGPFFAQCYIAAPAAFVFGIATILGRAHDLNLQIAGAAISTLTVIWYVSIETIWLKDQAGLTTPAAARSAFHTWLLATLINAVISAVILGV